MTPEQYCEDKAVKSGSSFYSSFRFLPAPKRLAITALYAFCREVDDVVDETHNDAVARKTLDWWRAEIDNLYAGGPQHPVTRALLPHIKAFDLQRELFLEIIDGMEMDLDIPNYASFKDLQLYCYRVASVVGQLSAQIFGYTDRKTLKYAHDLGLAFQLTNIIRDVGEDARRGRVYLPQDDLERFRIREAQIANGDTSGLWRPMMAKQIERTRKMLQAGAPLGKVLKGRLGLELRLIILGGDRILKKLHDSGGDVFHHRPVLTWKDWLYMLWRALRPNGRRTERSCHTC